MYWFTWLNTSRILNAMDKCKKVAGYEFIEVPLVFSDKTDENVFARKNNRTLWKTLTSKRYRNIAQCEQLANLSEEELRTPLGEFLMRAKAHGKSVYKLFLNDYGDLKYVTFAIAERNFYGLKGVYAYFVDDKLMYVGRCTDSMRVRVNNGYGRIAPKNCYKDGQSTNCRVNSLIQQAKGDVTLWLHQMDEKEAISERESMLIAALCPAWNVRK